MKNLKIFLVAFLTLALNVNVNAQTKQEAKPTNTGRFYVQTLKRQLNINEEDKEEFTKLYLAYFKESNAIKASGRNTSNKTNKELSDKEVRDRIMLSFDKSEEILTLKRAYYEKFEKVLSPRQILKMYKTEETIRTRITDEKKKRTAKPTSNPSKRPQQ